FEGSGGAEVIVVSGAAVSITQVNDAGVGSTLSAASIARTSKVCVPSPSVTLVNGEVHAPNTPASRRHSKRTPLSFAVNENEGLELFEGFAGDAVIVVSGAVRSTTQVNDAGVGSTLPAASIARTWKVCEPSARVPVLNGDVQATNAPLSMRHSKRDPSSLEVNAKSPVR